MNILLNVKARFSCAVKSGRKRQTMRPQRKRPFRRGDTLRIYTGLRQKGARLLKVAEIKSVEEISLRRNGFYYKGKFRWGRNQPEFDGNDFTGRTSRHQLGFANQMARSDGFKDYPEMWEFFKELYAAKDAYPVIRLMLIKW